jgi:excisionase family DNA binding protein
MTRKRSTATPDAALLMQQGTWTAAEVAGLLDVPLVLVERWALAGLVPGARMESGAWRLPGRGLFLFLGRKVEAHYSVSTVAGLLDRPAATVRDWIADKRLRVVKLGAAKASAVLIPESAVLELLKPERRVA